MPYFISKYINHTTHEIDITINLKHQFRFNLISLKNLFKQDSPDRYV